MHRIPKTCHKILLTVTAVMFLLVGLTATALNAATFDASMTSTLQLTGITLPNVTGISPLSVSNIDFSGSLELPLSSNNVSGPASTDGTSVSYTINNNVVSSEIPGAPVGFGSGAGFGIGDYFSLSSEAFSTSDTTDPANAAAAGIGTLNLTSTSNFDYQVYFRLTWSMSATTTEGLGVNSVAETFIFADLLGGETTEGLTILADTLGRSVNGVGDYTNVTVTTDFSLLLVPGESRSIQVQFNEALGSIDSGGEAPPAPVNPVPIPATLWLFGGGLICLAGLRRRTTHNG